VARAGQLRAQGALFSFLTVFFAGIAAAAYRADGWQKWPFVVAAAALTLWMGSLAIRTFRAAREEMTR
jgi:hypothetical protein